MPSIESRTMLAAAADAADEKKAEDIRILQLDPSESGLADYFMICSGNSDRQNTAIADEIEFRLKREFGQYARSVEGRRQGEWILMDYVDFIVHIFTHEKRAFYSLERLRKTATVVTVAELLATPKKVAAKKVPAVVKKVAAPAKKVAAKRVVAKTPAKKHVKKVAAKKAPAKKVLAKKAPVKKTPAKKAKKK